MVARGFAKKKKKVPEPRFFDMALRKINDRKDGFSPSGRPRMNA